MLPALIVPVDVTLVLMAVESISIHRCESDGALCRFRLIAQISNHCKCTLLTDMGVDRKILW